METTDKRRLLRLLLPPVLLAVVAVLLVIVGQRLTAPGIAAARHQHGLAMVNRVLPLAHDNDLLADVGSATLPGQPTAVSLYRARQDGRPVGLVMVPVVARGYVDTVELAVGISYDGAVTGVEVVRHRETRGLGDQVHQDRSSWLQQFYGRSLDTTATPGWAVRTDGGEFDALSGATITPRGIINAIRDALEWHAAARDSLYR